MAILSSCALFLNVIRLFQAEMVDQFLAPFGLQALLVFLIEKLFDGVQVLWAVHAWLSGCFAHVLKEDVKEQAGTGVGGIGADCRLVTGDGIHVIFLPVLGRILHDECRIIESV